MSNGLPNVLETAILPQDLLKVLAKNIVSSVPGVNLVINDLRVEPARRHRVGVQIDWANGSMALVRSRQRHTVGR